MTAAEKEGRSYAGAACNPERQACKGHWCPPAVRHHGHARRRAALRLVVADRGAHHARRRTVPVMTRAQTSIIVAASLACLAVAGWAYADTGPGLGKYLASCRAHHVLGQCNRSLRLWKEHR